MSCEIETPFIIILFISTVNYMVEIYGPATSAEKLFNKIRIKISGKEQETKYQYLRAITEEKQGYDMY